MSDPIRDAEKYSQSTKHGIRKKNSAPKSSTMVAKKKKTRTQESIDSAKITNKLVSKVRSEREEDLNKGMKAEIKYKKSKK